MPTEIRIGLGSWSDDEYRGVLYPPGLSPKDRLRHYATVFSHVEVNSTYYGAPRPETVGKWIAETPPGFLFDIKLHRIVSMNPAKAASVAKEGRDLLAYTRERLEPLAEAGRLGAFLLLLPARFAPDRHSLAELENLATRLRPFALAVELRDPAWLLAPRREETLRVFRQLGFTLVNVDMPRGKEFLPPLEEVTNPALAYLRLHGRNRKGYLERGSAEEQHRYRYKARELKEVCNRVERLSRQANAVRVVCNNHASDYAPRAALMLKRLLRTGGGFGTSRSKTNR